MNNRRSFLKLTTSTMVAIGSVFAVWPFIDSMNPSADVLALGTKEFDLSNIEKGSSKTVKWRGKPVFIRKRTEDEIREAKTVNITDLKDPEADVDRVKKDEWLEYPEVEHIHHFGWYIGNYPGLKEDAIIKLCQLLNES